MEDPGTRFRYSEGTTVLGRLVEIWSGQTFDAFLEERIFKPLGMADTALLGHPGAARAARDGLSVGAGGGLQPFEIEPESPFTERPMLLEGRRRPGVDRCPISCASARCCSIAAS